ncbi:unnamed protein product [Medioppia subpectinata]|uniref:Uncharacterized protein n=1 Tax=Medioppia subpectinata TaxID=1979941 RepID=A0A7R9KXJ8_9ACAR|nr:unnamed protein product [Medioppia subpectinata]CAG2110421.1 unnamed protein product [Medioppia subpectinata]
MPVDSDDEDSAIFDRLFSTDFEDESILLQLSTDEELPQKVLNFQNFCAKRGVQSDSGSHYEYVCGLINLTQKLSQLEDNAIIDLWIKSDKQSANCVLTEMFEFLPDCYIDASLPKFIDLSQIDHTLRMTFYEYLCFVVCQLMPTLSDNHLSFVEQTLFDNLLSEDYVCHQLAADVLCFIARFSKPSPLCYQLCSDLMSLSVDIDHSLLPNTTALLNRLLPFLKSSELDYLIRDYDLFTHSKVWCLLNVSRVLSLQDISQTVAKFDRLRYKQ